MLNFYTKYLFIVFWTLQVLEQTSLPFHFYSILYLIIGLSLIYTFVLLLKNRSFFFNKSFLLVLIIIAIYACYWILFDHSFFGIQYLFSKIAIFGMIMATIYFNYDYVEKRYPIIMLVISTLILVVGVLTNHDFGTRYSGPFDNTNSLGFLAVLAFSIALFYLKPGLKKTSLLIFFIALVLMSGSRNALGGLVLAYLLKDGFSYKKIAVIFMALVMMLGINKITSSYGFTTGIDRLVSTSKKNDLLAGRDLEFKLGLLSIKEKPIEGHGLDHYAHLSDNIVMRSGILRVDNAFAANPHNSFLGNFIQLGVPFGMLLLLTLVYYIGKSIFFKPRNDLFLIMLLYPFLSGLFESHLFGINGYEGTTFWFALLFYQIYMTKYKKERSSQP
ncbi:O-antigen ligase family protein [Hydrogenimonas cancrithermarum]|uniref:O-antigen ligase-related domain-containing protein n=1 Tax=Hydrogenimonas cancrithermarum TaxID=2993563 RepID=A0ABM8FMC6_9BACT|nr:O-antigen ligase family protein [Hydrogenimonas cancrithermarum]BDY13540.1 hypothetical protein HCR_18520 [Hydrogenimonas cancrithermarum]